MAPRAYKEITVREQHTPREYIGMALKIGSSLNLGNATQEELDELVREYLATMADIARN